MGAARGLDVGLISGTFNSKDFQRLLSLDHLDKVAYANVKGNVSAMVQIGSVAGAVSRSSPGSVSIACQPTLLISLAACFPRL